MQLYEVIRWGNESDDPMTGGVDGKDTCFLVRARSVEEAAGLTDHELARMPHGQVAPWSHAVYLLGSELASSSTPQVLRGPYVQSAYRYGWRHWYRETPDEVWEEKTAKT